MLRLHLRDHSEAIASAWKSYFSEDPDVEISTGDIFGATADAIVSPANSFGYMDGGIDFAYSKHFGWELEERLRHKLAAEHHGELPVGQAVIVPTGNRDIPWLISAPTMRVPMDVAETANAYLAFRAALRAALSHGTKIRSILCPGLATLSGRMPPHRCAIQMHLAWSIVVRGRRWPHPLIPETFQAHHALCSA